MSNSTNETEQQNPLEDHPTQEIPMKKTTQKAPERISETTESLASALFAKKSPLDILTDGIE